MVNIDGKEHLRQNLFKFCWLIFVHIIHGVPQIIPFLTYLLVLKSFKLLHGMYIKYSIRLITPLPPLFMQCICIFLCTPTVYSSQKIRISLQNTALVHIYKFSYTIHSHEGVATQSENMWIIYLRHQIIRLVLHKLANRTRRGCAQTHKVIFISG